ncbi:MAG: hypothetical protein VKL59_11730 [Nostocaceae cyanobacterium]|nr:hypothetical protein [Nostocaceae cyanobacterium]
MARYTGYFTVAVAFEHLKEILVDVLQTCNLDIIYDAGDYVMAKEIPGKVSFSKLVTVEVLIDKTTATETETRMNCVIKNEELPLQVENHCRQMFELVTQAIVNSRHWRLIDSIAAY